jgi:hypothetical protein
MPKSAFLAGSILLNARRAAFQPVVQDNAAERASAAFNFRGHFLVEPVSANY